MSEAEINVRLSGVLVSAMLNQSTLLTERSRNQQDMKELEEMLKP